MDNKLFICMALLIFNEVQYLNGYCTRIEDDNCDSYTVVCSRGVDNLQKHCSNAAVTFVLKNFVADTFNGNEFSNTDSSFDPTVRVIQGIDNNWNTLGSEVFHYYRNTIKIDLSDNHIKFISNEAFSGLNSLENINLSRNAIETLRTNSLEISNGRSSYLHTLDLSSNNLSYIETNAFQKLLKLRNLYLDNNKLNSLDNNIFANLENLNYLTLRNNRLTSLNNVLQRAHSLEILDLSQNRLTHLHGFETISLRLLVSFNASWNAIETVDSNCFSQAYSLKTLDLSCNKIASPIESTMFITNNRLEYLNLYNNSISDIQGSAFKNTKLNYLNLESNLLSGIIGEYTFSGIQGTQLNLSNYGIEVIKNFAFSNAPSLVYLNLSHNIISTIEDHGIDSIPILSILDLSYNSINNINFLQFCCFYLNELYLRDNKLESLPQSFHDNYLFIKTLDISKNNIAVLGQGSLPLGNLKYLSIEDNLLKGNIEKNIFSPSKYMEKLDLSNMKFKVIKSEGLTDMPLVFSLNISHNEISFIDSHNFMGFNNLTVLDISYNQIKTLDINPAVLKKLQLFHLSNNNFESISDMVSHCNSLMILDVSYNQIEDISTTPFDNSPTLQALYLSHNKIQSFNNQHTNKLTTLSDLKLSSNKLNNLNLSYFTQLENLELRDINLKAINKQFLQNLHKLKYLDLSLNDIDDLPPGSFHNINGLRYLNISSNKLLTIRFGSLNDLHSIEQLDISWNIINNLDINLFHDCTTLEKLIIDYNDITKLDVDGLIEILPNLKTISLGGNPFSCKEIIRIIKNLNHTHSSVLITSIDKVHHDDNIHGIKCKTDGQKWTNARYIQHRESSERVYDYGYQVQSNIIEDVSTREDYAGLTAWCSILTIILVISVFTFGYYYNKQHNILGDILKPLHTFIENHRPSYV